MKDNEGRVCNTLFADLGVGCNARNIATQLFNRTPQPGKRLTLGLRCLQLTANRELSAQADSER